MSQVASAWVISGAGSGAGADASAHADPRLTVGPTSSEDASRSVQLVTNCPLVGCILISNKGFQELSCSDLRCNSVPIVVLPLITPPLTRLLPGRRQDSTIGTIFDVIALHPLPFSADDAVWLPCNENELYGSRMQSKWRSPLD